MANTTITDKKLKALEESTSVRYRRLSGRASSSEPCSTGWVRVRSWKYTQAYARRTETGIEYRKSVGDFHRDLCARCAEYRAAAAEADPEEAEAAEAICFFLKKFSQYAQAERSLAEEIANARHRIAEIEEEIAYLRANLQVVRDLSPFWDGAYNTLWEHSVSFKARQSIAVAKAVGAFIQQRGS